jgi:hypothetical protein
MVRVTIKGGVKNSPAFFDLMGMPSMIKTLLVALALVICLPGAASAEQRPGAMMPSIQQESHRGEPFRFEGALSIRIHPAGDELEPPAELLLTDPEGRRVGRDPIEDATFSEVPDASYGYEGIDDAVSGAPGPQTAIVDMRNPMTGQYSLQVIGKGSAKYDLSIRGYDGEMDPSDAEFRDVMIQKGSEHLYFIEYSNDKGSRVEAVRAPDSDD